MKLFIDSANLEEIEKAYATGVIDGITTNPSLLKKALSDLKKGKKKFSIEEYVTDILIIAKNPPVSLEVNSTDHDAIVKEATALYNHFNPISNNVYIKVPINTSLTGKTKQTEAIRAIKTLTQSRIPVNATLVFTPEQALLAAKAGASIVSIFTGRIDDYIRTQHGIGFEKQDYYPQDGLVKDGKHVQDNGIVSGVDCVKQAVSIIKQHNLRSMILAASIRNTRQLREVALAGAHIATVPFDVIMSSLNHPKTLEGIKIFSDDVPNEYLKLLK